jgi:hypothetical protein
MVNSSLAIFAKDGRPLMGPLPTRTLFAGFGGACEERGDGDGIVLYDPLADRWLVTQLAIIRGAARPYHMCMAVSRTGDPSGQWARYDYSYVDFHDYPKFGVWPDGYYVTSTTTRSSASGPTGTTSPTTPSPIPRAIPSTAWRTARSSARRCFWRGPPPSSAS